MKNTKETMRISKFLADQGVCSRREAEEIINRGWVFLNGKKVTEQGVKIIPGDDLRLSEDVENWLHGKTTIILNKPPGYVSAQAEEGKVPAIKLITKSNFYGDRPPSKIDLKGLAPAGRLDLDSTGLLILSQDGRLVKKIIGPESKIEKEYIVKVEGDITPNKLARLRFGLELDGKALKKAQVKRLNETQLSIILIEGKKRQIRRMCELVDLKVLTLKRIRIGELKLGNLPRGKWRLLKPSERI